MTQVRTIVFDKEAIQALSDTRHRKHMRALTAIHATADSRVQRKETSLLVATAVRVEAGWDRTHPKPSAINRFHIDDVVLDGPIANQAARLRTLLDVSVADAHIGAVLASTPGPHAVITSDPEDVRRIADHIDADVRVVIL
ncbi:MAG: hypothetical protein M3394_09830 [Actinomycetota bacterium]|nr:hypothetical protein [Actinomycetota bacterium]